VDLGRSRRLPGGRRPHLLDGGQAAPQTWEQAAAAVNLQLAPADFGNDRALVSRPFAGTLKAFSVLDSDRNVTYISRDQLRAWGTSEETLQATALANLDRMSGGGDLAATPAPDGRGRFLVVDATDGYAAARLLSPAFRRRIADRLGAHFYAAVPNRDFLVAWSLDYSRQEQFASKAAVDFRERPHPVSPQVFLVSADYVQVAGQP